MRNALLFAWILFAPVFPQGQNAILLKHANIIDGISNEPIRDAAVQIEGGQIAAVRSGIQPIPAGAVVIDLAGRWLLPGLIDAHVHLDDLKGARNMVRAGVTTMRTAHVDHYIDVGIRELHRRGAADLPDVVAAG